MAGSTYADRRVFSSPFLSRNDYPMSMKSVVSEKGQVTIPKALRDRLGLVPGQVVDFSEDRGTLVGRKVAPVDPVAASFGIVQLGRSTDAWMTGLRGEEEPV